MIKQERVIHQFMELVQIDSETKNEHNISNVLKEQFTQLGLSIYEDDTMEKTGHGAGNLIVTLEADGAPEAAPIFLPATWIL